MLRRWVTIYYSGAYSDYVEGETEEEIEDNITYLADTIVPLECNVDSTEEGELEEVEDED